MAGHYTRVHCTSRGVPCPPLEILFSTKPYTGRAGGGWETVALGLTRLPTAVELRHGDDDSRREVVLCP